MISTPALELLLGGYLNEDWPDEYGSIWTAIDSFIAHEPARAPYIPGEITLLLAATDSAEKPLRQQLRALGSAYAADWDGGTYRGWLEEVSARVAAALG